MICAHIVVGIRDSALSKRLQMDHDLTLEKAKKLVYQKERQYMNGSNSSQESPVKEQQWRASKNSGTKQVNKSHELLLFMYCLSWVC